MEEQHKAGSTILKEREQFKPITSGWRIEGLIGNRRGRIREGLTILCEEGSVTLGFPCFNLPFRV